MLPNSLCYLPPDPEQPLLPPTTLGIRPCIQRSIRTYIHTYLDISWSPWAAPSCGCVSRWSHTSTSVADARANLIFNSMRPSASSLSLGFINLIWLVLISCNCVPAPKPSRQQTNGAAGLQSWRLCPDTHVGCKRLRPEATGKQPLESLAKRRHGRQMCVHIQYVHACVCVLLCAHGGGESPAWFDRGVLEATALITATARVLRGGRSTEKVTSCFFCCRNMGQVGSGWAARR